MTNMSEQMDSTPTDDISQPETTNERRICKATAVGCMIFIAATLYYLVTPRDDGLRDTMIIVAGVIFVATLLNFFRAMFCGKLCGQQKH